MPFCDFQVFPDPLHTWNRKWKWSWWIFFYLVWFSRLLNGWSIFWAKPEYLHLKTLDVIHERQTHTHIQTHRADCSNTQIHSWMNLRKKGKNSPTEQNTALAFRRISAPYAGFFHAKISSPGLISPFSTWPDGNVPTSQLTEHRGITSAACLHVLLYCRYIKRSYSFIDSLSKTRSWELVIRRV
jgi:hypothetical protein